MRKVLKSVLLKKVLSVNVNERDEKSDILMQL